MSTDTSVQNNSRIQSEHYAIKRVLSCTKTFIKRLIVRKSMKILQAEIDTRNELRRDLNWIQLLAMNLGATIGDGQDAAKYSGPSIIISFIITGVIALLSSLSYSELEATMPSSGSVFTYTYAGQLLIPWEFIEWNSALLYLFGVLTMTVAWSKYVVLFIGTVSDYNATSMIVEAPVTWNKDAERFFVAGQAINLSAIGITIAITILLIIRIRQTVIVNLVEYGITGMLEACTYVFFVYGGFDSVSTVEQEAKSPERSLPIATIGSTVVSLLLYIGICTVMVGLVPCKLLDTYSPLSEAM
ncbi:unnamed protein product [Rotaria sp. Silwood2]|nr:unnamed protein product [Rotaria sp. Silwood2]CAF4274313.1 unnamed protein product [Rotaria sp. Silwood2]CAF4281886.1 unnamed protein product [Rotaria sp. Silwood2]CAF4311721.1 unnamed protein product [Rotaria sp. Silwood2]